jgi:hypothetical protein
MLTLPSIHSSIGSASVAASRPALVSEAVRSVSPFQAIEPTTAISKERSRAENRKPEATPVASGAGQPKAADAGGAEGRAPPVQEGQGGAPPSERSAIQKALDLQVKELLNNLWQASAAAVDFLLNRKEPTPAQVAASVEPLTTIQESLVAVPGSRYTPVASSRRGGDGDNAGLYSPAGAAAGEPVQAPGQLLDILA